MSLSNMPESMESSWEFVNLLVNSPTGREPKSASQCLKVKFIGLETWPPTAGSPCRMAMLNYHGHPRVIPGSHRVTHQGQLVGWRGGPFWAMPRFFQEPLHWPQWLSGETGIAGMSMFLDVYGAPELSKKNQKDKWIVPWYYRWVLMVSTMLVAFILLVDSGWCWCWSKLG